MNPVALASGVLPEFGPIDIIRAAEAARFDMVGLWVEPELWTSALLQEVKATLADTALPVIDVEVLWQQPGKNLDDHLRILDIGMEVGAANALCVSSCEDQGEVAEWLSALCGHVEGSDLRVNLEFGIFTKVPNLQMARAIVEQVEHPAAAILIDPIHVDRCGMDLAELEALPASLISYAQFCDASANRPDPKDMDAVIVDAIDARLHAGEGVVDLDWIYRALPADLPLSVELRSEALRNAFPDDPAGRACAVADAMRKWLEGRS